MPDWAEEAEVSGGALWLNPPYGRTIGLWMAKAVQASAVGAIVVALVPARTDTVWWHDHVMAATAEVRLIRRRLHFGGAVPLAVVVYRPGRGRPGSWPRLRVA